MGGVVVGGEIEHGSKLVAELIHRLRLHVEPTVDESLPRLDEACGVPVQSLRDMLNGQRQTVAFGAGIANRDAMYVCEAREKPAVEQCERETMLATIPERSCGAADVCWQRFRADVEIPDVSRNGEGFFPRGRLSPARDASEVVHKSTDQHGDDAPHQHPRRAVDPAKEVDDPGKP